MTPPDPLGALLAPAPTATGLPGAATQPGTTGDAAAAGEFEVLVSRLLAGTGEAPAPAPGTVVAQATTAPLPATVPAKIPATAADTGTDEESDEGEGPDPSPAAAGVLPGTVAWLLPPALVQAGLASAPPTPGSATTGSATAPTQPAATQRTGTTVPAGPGTTARTDDAASPDEAPPAAAPALALQDIGPSTPATPPTAAATMTPVTAAAAARADATTSAPTPVTRQVFPEVVRLAASGEGTATRRVSLLLEPESLGEVRVVLTTRHGELQVTLSAGGDTHRALLEGTPELRRLLETIGSPDARVVVRDLPGSPAGTPQASASRADTPTDLSSGSGAGTGHPGDGPPPHPSGRESTTATDGTHDAAVPQRRTESVTRARTAGLDVTM